MGRKTFRTTGDGAGESLSFPVESSEWFGCVAVSEIQLGTCVQHLPAQERGIWSWGLVDGEWRFCVIVGLVNIISSSWQLPMTSRDCAHLFVCCRGEIGVLFSLRERFSLACQRR